jgi:hypothetical protein
MRTRSGVEEKRGGRRRAKKKKTKQMMKKYERNNYVRKIRVKNRIYKKSIMWIFLEKNGNTTKLPTYNL